MTDGIGTRERKWTGRAYTYYVEKGRERKGIWETPDVKSGSKNGLFALL